MLAESQHVSQQAVGLTVPGSRMMTSSCSLGLRAGMRMVVQVLHNYGGGFVVKPGCRQLSETQFMRITRVGMAVDNMRS
jgi:hypothetical protein